MTLLASWIRSDMRDYYLQGSAVIDQDLIFSPNQCEITDVDISAYTPDQMKEIQRSILSPKLSERVTATAEGFVVDKVRAIKIKARQQEALNAWKPYCDYFKKSMIISGTFAAACTVLAFQRVAAIYIIAAALSSVVATYFAGVFATRYYAAERQMSAWQNPGNELALSRTLAYQKNFPDILELTGFPQGGLLPKEIQPHYAAHFEFYFNHLQKACKTPEEQYGWLAGFFNIKYHPLDPEVLTFLFIDRFQTLGEAFTYLEKLQLVVMTKSFTPIGQIIEEMEAADPRLIPLGSRLVQAMAVHYRQEFVRLKEVFIQDASLKIAYETARMLFEQAGKIILNNEQVPMVDVHAVQRPANYPVISHEFYPNEPVDTEYGKFIAEVKRRAQNP